MSKSLSRLALCALAGAAAVIAGCASTQTEPPGAAPAQAPSQERVFSSAVGDIVVAASQKLAAEPPDLAGALADLDRAFATPGVTAYEAGVILYMRGGAKYQLDDSDGALDDWTRALTEGDMSASERLSITYNVGQLHLSRGDYEAGVDQLESWIDAGGVADDQVLMNLAAACFELGDMERALEHARESFRLAAPPDRRHYDVLALLYTELGRFEERNDIQARAREAGFDLTQTPENFSRVDR
jgi:tetratricopeptide (TPR) repeat protein